jgi:hypothetical protein
VRQTAALAPWSLNAGAGSGRNSTLFAMPTCNWNNAAAGRGQMRRRQMDTHLDHPIYFRGACMTNIRMPSGAGRDHDASHPARSPCTHAMRATMCWQPQFSRHYTPHLHSSNP